MKKVLLTTALILSSMSIQAKPMFLHYAVSETEITSFCSSLSNEYLTVFNSDLNKYKDDSKSKAFEKSLVSGYCKELILVSPKKIVDDKMNFILKPNDVINTCKQLTTKVNRTESGVNTSKLYLDCKNSFGKQQIMITR